MKILVVDDQPPIRLSLKQMVEKLGYECILACDGEEALQVIDQRDDLNMLICDMHMQDIDGLEVLQNSKAINPKLPVVLMSDYSKDETIIEALRKGASDYLVKPFEMMQLESVIIQVEELFQNRAQIINNRHLINNLELNFEIPSQDLEVHKVQAILKNTLQIYSQISNKDLLNFTLTVEESMLNAHEHGNLELVSDWKEEFIGTSGETRFDITKKERLQNPTYAKRVVKIKLCINSRKISISIEDEGQGYPVNVIGSDATGKPFGMGLMLIKNLSDNIFFNESGSRITIEKFLPKKQNENTDS